MISSFLKGNRRENMTSLNGKSMDEYLECENFKKGLKDAEHVIQYINKKYISLDDSDYQIYADHLKNVVRYCMREGAFSHGYCYCKL